MSKYTSFKRDIHDSPLFSRLDALAKRMSDWPPSLAGKGLFQRVGIMNRLHQFKSLCRGISALALVSGLLFGMPGVVPVFTGLAAPEDAQPEIISIQMEVSEVVVTVRVPKGIMKVTLEGRSRLGVGNWAPRAIKRVDGSGGLLVIRIAYTKANEILRVRGDDKEELSAVFYKGTTDFSGQKDEGGDVLTPAPGRGNEFDSVAEAGDANKDDGGEQRDVVESDIWSIHNDTLYFFNSLRGLQVIDLKDKSNPVIRGVLPMPAAGEQMYTLGDKHVILLVRDGCNWWGNDAESQAIIVNVAGNTPVIEASVPVKGYIRESRLVGTALYIASQTYITKQAVNPTTGDSYTRWEHGTQVSAFDLKTPSKPVAHETVFYSGYNNDIYATDKFLFVSTSVPKDYYKTDLRCIDISAPNGTMKEAATIRTAGRVADKFKMRLSDDTLTVISEELKSNSNDNRNRWLTTLETFSLANPHKPEALGALSLAKGERLFATRFDADRVYIVTYERIDPLWIVDLSDPRKPVIKGELEVPGWSTYIQPLGDRLVSIGVDDTNNGRRVAVSLFDGERHHQAETVRQGHHGRPLVLERGAVRREGFHRAATRRVDPCAVPRPRGGRLRQERPDHRPERKDAEETRRHRARAATAPCHRVSGFHPVDLRQGTAHGGCHRPRQPGREERGRAGVDGRSSHPDGRLSAAVGQGLQLVLRRAGRAVHSGWPSQDDRRHRAWPRGYCRRPPTSPAPR